MKCGNHSERNMFKFSLNEGTETGGKDGLMRLEDSEVLEVGGHSLGTT